MQKAGLYEEMELQEINRIAEIKMKLGDQLIILGHYYQRLPIALLSDHLGDSYGLSAIAARSDRARHIVFCGVDFMAESAEILRRSDQRVYHPNSDAGCPMSDMAEPLAVERAYELVCRKTSKKVIPVAYMNTSSEVKAFCGRHNGLICTSSNATKAFRWAFDQGDVVFFIPDEHLGTNTANQLGIPVEERALYDPLRDDEGNENRLNSQTRLVLWKGYCHVHTWFSPEQIKEAKAAHPEATVVVHPECPEEVVALADHTGSTAFMHRFIEEAPEGSTTIIGTEINLVEFLRHQYGSGKKILPLSRSFCPNMYKVNLEYLRTTLETVQTDRFLVTVPDEIKEEARIALNRMLDLNRQQ